MPGLIDLHAHAGTSLIKQVAEHFPGPEVAQHLRLHRLSCLARLVVPGLAVLQPGEAEVRHDHQPLHARLRAALGQSRIRLRQCRGRREDRHSLDHRRRPVAPALSARLHLLGKRPPRRTGWSRFEESLDKMEETIAHLEARRTADGADVGFDLAAAQREPERSGLRSGQRQIHAAAGGRAAARHAGLRCRLPPSCLRDRREVHEGDARPACSGRRRCSGMAGRSTWTPSTSSPRRKPASRIARAPSASTCSKGRCRFPK